MVSVTEGLLKNSLPGGGTAVGVVALVDCDDVGQQGVGGLDAAGAGAGHRDRAEEVGVEGDRVDRSGDSGEWMM